MALKQKILKTATEMFFRYGIKRVTMDDISREMGISKKTLYQHYKEKDEIISVMCDKQIEMNLCDMDEIEKKAKDPVHEIIMIQEYVSKLFSKINPVFFYEAKRFYPNAWVRLEEFKHSYMKKALEKNIKKGMAMKIYRADINVQLMAQYRLWQFDISLDPDTFPTDKITLGELQVVLLDHFLYGITTLKGHKLINKYKKLKDDQ